jgi:DsbC/DsbD-like thiol-disulfide interchange protein
MQWTTRTTDSSRAGGVPRKRRNALPRVLAITVAGIAATAGLVVALGSINRLWTPALAQTMNAGVPAAPKGGHVTFIADGQSIAANKPATLQLHFRVDDGFHINSHTPKSDMLIPTKIIVVDSSDVQVADVDFPTGTPYAFAFEPKTKLDVYTGDVTLTAHIKAAKPGAYTLKAALHYQACDQAACYPPKTLALEQPFTAK